MGESVKMKSKAGEKRRKREWVLGMRRNKKMKEQEEK